MGLDGRFHGNITPVPHANAVADLEPAFLASALNAIDHFPRPAFPHEVVIQLDVEVDGHVAVRDRIGAFARLAQHLNLVSVESFTVNLDPALILQGIDLRAVETRDLGVELAHALAEALAQHREVRFRNQGDVLALVGLVAHLLDVEFRPDVALQRLHLGQQRLVLMDDGQRPQGRSQVDPHFLALAPTELDDLLHPRHGILEQDVALAVLSVGIPAQVHRSRRRLFLAG